MTWSTRKAACHLLLVLCAGLGPVAMADAGAEVMNIDSHWRYHAATRRGPLYHDADELVNPAQNQAVEVPLVRGEWTAVEHDDSDWTLHRGALLPGQRHPVGHGQGENTRISHLQVRGKFQVDAPRQVRSLTLAARYRGGLVVYLNGQEVARAQLGPGPIDSETVATGYGANVLNPNPEDPDAARQSADLRLRSLGEIALPVDHLRQGVNVLAIHVVAAPLPTEADQKHSHQNRWATAGLQELSLKISPEGAVRPNVGMPDGVQVWTTDVLTDLDAIPYGDPAELAGGIRPIRLVAARNMTVSGQVVLSSRQPVQGAEATIGAFSGPGRIPPQAVRLRYPARATPQMDWQQQRPDALLDRPTGDETVQPVWVTVQVPADAAPGRYRAMMQVRASGLARAVEVPVELLVYGWDCPDPQAWRSMVSMVQSPHSVAWQYGVDEWSDRHMELLAPSLSMMRALGNNVVYIDVIHPSFFGPEHGLIVFNQTGGRLAPDFTAFDRYLDAYARHVGEPRRIVLVLWEPNVERQGLTVSVRRPDGSLTHQSVPLYGEEGSEPTWRAVMDGVRQRVLQRGWDERAITIGTGHDSRPRGTIVQFFNEIAPYASWMLFTHGRGDPQVRDGSLTIGEMRVSYQEYPYWAVGRGGRLHQGLHGGWVRDWYETITLYAGRMMLNDNSPPAQFRLFPGFHVVGGSAGLCRQGIDKWPVVNPHRPGDSPRRRVHGTPGWGNLYRHKVRSIAAPGPRGALETVRFEMMRQGLQETEARIYVEQALRDPQKRPALTDAIEQETRAINEADWAYHGVMSGNQITPGTLWNMRMHRRIALAAEVQRRLNEAGLE